MGAELLKHVDGWLIVAVEVNLRVAQARAEGPQASMNGIKFLYTNVGGLYICTSIYPLMCSCIVVIHT